MADKDLTIKIRTQGDPSGAKGVSQAIDGIGATSSRTAEIVTRDQRRMAEAAASAAAAMRAGAVADTGGGRSWSIPGAGAVSTRGASGGGASISVPSVAPSAAPVSVPRPASPSGGSGGGSGGLDAIAPAAEKAADSARSAAQGLDGVADSAAKIKADKIEDATKAAGEGAEETANWAEKFTAFDSASDEITEVIDGWKALKGEAQDSSQTQADGMQKASDAAVTLKESIAAALEAETAAADAAMEAEAEKTEAKEESAEVQEENTKAAEEGAEAEAESAGDVAEHVGAVVDALEAKKKKSKEAAQEEKKHGEAAEESSGKMGQAAMTVAQFADDAQYGLKGIMNNIPQVVQALGLGPGVAGVAGIAIVAINQLIDKIDFFSSTFPSAVQKTTEELHQMTAELARSRNEAAKATEDWTKAQKNGLANKKELEEIAKKYKAIADNIRLAADARRALNLAIMEESDAELGFKLSEIELKRSKGEITDIEAEEQSQNTRRAYVKSQAELKKQEQTQDIADQEAGIENMRKEQEEQVAYIQKMKKIAADLLPDKDFDVLTKTKDTAVSQLAELRQKANEAEEALREKTEIAERRFGPDATTVDRSDGTKRIVNQREFYVKEEKEAADKARLAEERGRIYAKEQLDKVKKVEDAQEQAGPNLKDSYRMYDHIASLEEKAAAREAAIRAGVSSVAVNKQKMTREQRALELRQATEENLGVGKLAGMRQSKEEEERQKLDREREYREQLQDEKDAKMWEERKKREEANRKAAQDDAARRRLPVPDFGESQVDKQQKEHEEAKRIKRREEERARELALEKEKQDKLSLTIQDGDPYKKPTDRSAPVRPGFPRATIPAEIDRPSPLPPDPQITTVPMPAAGDDTKVITSQVDDFLARTNKGTSLSGGDPRTAAVKKANDLLKEGGSAAAYQGLANAIHALEGTILLSKREENERMKKLETQLLQMGERIKKTRN